MTARYREGRLHTEAVLVGRTRDARDDIGSSKQERIANGKNGIQKGSDQGMGPPIEQSELFKAY